MGLWTAIIFYFGQISECPDLGQCSHCTPLSPYPSPVISFLLRACPERGRRMRTYHDVIFHFPGTTWVMMPTYITSSSITVLLRPWLPPWGTESWPARTPWVWGFFSGRGNRLYSEGELVYVLPEKGKEDCRNSWRCLWSTWKMTTCWTLAWISSNPLWGGLFFLGQNLREDQRSPEQGRLHCGGVPDAKSGVLNAGESPLGRWG